MADSLQTYTYLVKEVARCCGVFANFMPKPIQAENGSGMHTHISIFQEEGVNAFYSSDDPHHLSADAKHLIAGVLGHAREMPLVTNQWFNSYKRLVPGYDAPVYTARAERNLSALGEDMHRKLIETKLVEADEFRLYVSPKDLEENLVL